MTIQDKKVLIDGLKKLSADMADLAAFFKSNYKNPLFAGIGKRERQKGGKLS